MKYNIVDASILSAMNAAWDDTELEDAGAGCPECRDPTCILDCLDQIEESDEDDMRDEYDEAAGI